MNRGEYLQLQSEKTALDRMIAETPEEDVLDRASLVARLKSVESALSQTQPDEREPARVRFMRGALQGVLPKARVFEFKLADSAQVIRGKLSPAIADPDALNNKLHRPITIRVVVTRVGGGRPRYLLLELETTS